LRAAALSAVAGTEGLQHNHRRQKLPRSEY